MPPGRLFGLDDQTLIQIVAHIFNITLFVILLRWLLYKPVREFLKKREERIKGDIDFAEAEKAKANELKLQYEQEVKEIDNEKYEILESARKLAVEKSKESEVAAKAEADAIKARALKEIEMEQDRVKDEVKKTVIDVSTVMVAKFLSGAIDEEAQNRLFDETMAELEEIAWHN
jgi:F-type H+-transporting ATPase subunit b